MRNLILYSAAMTILAACSEGSLAPGYRPEDSPGSIHHEMIVLGERLQDPYSVTNMTKALNSLYPAAHGRERLEPTHYYIRFIPGDEDLLRAVEDMGLEYLDHPLDYSIIREGDYYHDPEIPEGEMTWLYTTLPVDAAMPEGVNYEIIDECYLPPSEAGTKASGDGIDWTAVEAEAYRLTGNAAALPTTRAAASGPRGRISIVDGLYDGGEPLGVAGVKVSCNSFVRFASCYTDEEGYYEMDKAFTGTPRYRLVFKNEKGFGIGLNLILVPASVSTLGKGGAAGVSVVVDKDSDRSLFTRCAVNNAAYDFWKFCSAERLRTPPSNLRIWLFRSMKTSAALMCQQGALVDGSIVSDYLGEYSSLLKMFLPDLAVALKGRDDYAGVYAEALHCLAHASHYMQVGNPFWNALLKNNLKSYVTSTFTLYGTGTEKDAGYTAIAEMWAYYLQNKLYRLRYSDSSASFGTSYWFSPQILMYMDDRGLDHFKIYSALTSDITAPGLLEEKLLYLYPEYKSTIMQAFMRYE